NRKLGVADTAPAALPEARHGTRIDQNSFLADLRQDVAVHKVATIGMLRLGEAPPTVPEDPAPGLLDCRRAIMALYFAWSRDKLANVKEATRILADNMGKDDVFSLTTFDTHVVPVVAPIRMGGAVPSIGPAIDGIQAGSTTNLSGGYEQGCAFA